MATMPSGKEILALEIPRLSAEAIQRGATIPKTTTGLCTIWDRSMARIQYINKTLERLPFAILEMPVARSVQNLVRLKPAATTLMAPIMITLLLEK